MSSILKKMWKFVSHAQVLAVFFSFALMAFLSYYFMSDIERKRMILDVNNVISNTQAYIEADLKEPSSVIGSISETIRMMILDGVGVEPVFGYIGSMTDYLLKDQQIMHYATGVYGVFDVFDGRFFTGIEWTPPDDYEPEGRPWYIAAVEANGSVGITEPYFDVSLGVIAITYTRRIFDEEGQPLGIVCLDVMLDRIRNHAINIYVSEGSYGILLDKQFNVIAHPHPSYLNKNLALLNDGERILNDLQRGREISELKAIDYEGNESVLFIRQLNNGWYLGVLAYSDKYFNKITEIAFILSILAFVLAFGLSAILLYITRGKKRVEERTKIMLDSLQVCTNFWDKDLKIADCNLAAIKMFDLPSKKEYIDNFYNLSPEYQPDGRLSHEKSLENIKMAFDEGYCRFEWLHRKLTGELIPCEVSLVRVSYRGTNIVCGYTNDLRELKSMITKMREADECMQILFDFTPLSCMMFDKDYKILECNQELIKMLGLANKEEFINNAFDFFPEHQPSGELSKDKIIKSINEAFEESRCHFECTLQKPDGEHIPAEVSLVRVKFRGVYAVAGYVRDLREFKTMIAEMRRAEVAEESNKAKSDFLAKMSHEIRTPMNAILGIAEIQLQNNALPVAIREAMERIYNSGDLLLGIIKDILDLSKIEAGRLELVYAQYNIVSLIHDIAKLNMIRYESKPIEFRLDVSEDIPLSLIGDELRIKQILNNILSNAFKYTQEGQIEMSVFTQTADDSSYDVMIVFSISDTGQGMTAEQIQKLGEKFHRFNMESNRKTEGTGLGMNITHNLLKLMNGNLSVESTPGMGSVFTIYLPHKCADNATIGSDLADNLKKLNLSNTTNLRKTQVKQDYMPYGRVLIVDDVETNLYVARGLMAPYGLSIETSVSGFEAVDKIRNGSNYDVIFMDHMMPKMDGIEATRIIRSLGYDNPVIALTANALVGQEEIFLNNGFDAFISKPIDIRELNASLNKFIRDKQPQEVLDEAEQLKNSLYASGKHNIAIEPQLAEFFVRDAEKVAEVLDNIYKNNCRRGDDISTLIINVHAMKSALANVGEKELSEEAAKLEEAGRENNHQFILSKLPEFSASLRNIIDKLKPDEDSAGESTDVINSEDYAYLTERLLDIQNACQIFDKKAAKQALSLLKQKSWPKAVREKLSAIAEHLLHSEFDEAAVIAREKF